MDMDVFARVRLTHVDIRKLLLMIGMVVAVVVLFQGFLFPYGKILSLSPMGKGSMVLTVANVTTMNSSNMFMEVINDRENKETNLDYNSALDIEKLLDDKYKNENSQEFAFNESVAHSQSLMVGDVPSTYNNSTKVSASDNKHGNLQNVEKLEKSYEIEDDEEATFGLTLGGRNHTREADNLDSNSRSSESGYTTNLSSVHNANQNIEILQPVASKRTQVLSIIRNNNQSTASISILRRRNKQLTSISQMNKLLFQRHASSSYSVRPRWSSVRDRELLSAKLEIENAPLLRNAPGLHVSVYRNLSMFVRSYELMERIVKVYVYKEGEKPIFHQSLMRGIYASEGWFMKLMERNKQFVVRDPRKAHLFYLPFSSHALRSTLIEQNFRSHKDLQKLLNKYVDSIARKYKFWNRTGGSDHFFVACHDWAPKFTRQRLKSCIKSLCNSNTASDFRIGTDTTLPVTYIRSAAMPVAELGGKPPSERTILAFFAGSMHGYLRPVLLKYWENKEPDMKISGSMPRDIEGKRIYREYMKSSKYCICARGYEVHTPRVVEAIFYECVPVILSDNYVPPFFEVLNWEAFAVFIEEEDIPNLRNILLSITEEKYLALQSGVKAVQKHFLWHIKPEKYDLFHMILHSIWYNRIFNLRTR